jgi:hypothetical protein
LDISKSTSIYQESREYREKAVKKLNSLLTGLVGRPFDDEILGVREVVDDITDSAFCMAKYLVTLEREQDVCKEPAKHKQYQAQIVRTGCRYATIVVTAEDEEEARHLALDTAHDTEFSSERDSEYVIDSIWEIE